MNPQPYTLRSMLPDPPRGRARVKRIASHILITTLATTVVIALVAAVNILFS